MRDLVADAVEVVEGQLDLGLAGDREQVQDGVGGTAEGHGDGDGVLERLLGHDVAGGDAQAQQVDHGFAGLAGKVITAAVRRGRGGRAGQGHAEGLADARHGVGRVHAAAGAFARADGAFDAVQVFEAHLAGGAGAHGFEGVDEGDFLFGAVLKLDPAGHDGAGVEEDGGEVQAGGGHQHARAGTCRSRPAARSRQCARPA